MSAIAASLKSRFAKDYIVIRGCYTVKQMPERVGAAYKTAVNNILFLKRQQWLATNYALILYAAIFVISAYYFNRTDFTRNLFSIIGVVGAILMILTPLSAQMGGSVNPGVDSNLQVRN